MSDEIKPEPAPPAPVRDVWEWKRLKGTEDWAFNGAARGEKWAVGEWVDHSFITEAAYDNAIRRAKFGR